MQQNVDFVGIVLWHDLEVPVVGDQVIIPRRTNQPILDVVTPAIRNIELLRQSNLTVTTTGNLNLED